MEKAGKVGRTGILGRTGKVGTNGKLVDTVETGIHKCTKSKPLKWLEWMKHNESNW